MLGNEQSGLCITCDDLMEEWKKKNKTIGKQKTFPRIGLDMKLLIDTHEKLASGRPVKPNVVNIPLLCGIRNVLCQSEEFEEALERVKVLEIQNTEAKLRLESLETWFIKLNKKVEDDSLGEGLKIWN